MNLYLGIDPGSNGGYGIISEDGGYVDCGRSVDLILGIPDNLLAAAVERQTLWQSDNRAAMFRIQKLLINYGWWCGALDIWHIPYLEVAPISWKSYFKLRGKDRRDLIALCRKLWPDAPIKFLKDDGKAVGLLLAEYLRQHKEKLSGQNLHS